MTSHAYDHVTELASWRRSARVGSVTVVLGGRHYGTFEVSAPVRDGEKLALYVVAQPESGGEIDCLVTDDSSLGDGGER